MGLSTWRWHRERSTLEGGGGASGRSWCPADALGVGLLLVLTAVGSWELVVGGTMVGQDTAAFFYPIYAALGERLGAGDVPGWNPHQFGGVPFAADPESGWTYLPAMVLFTLLPIAAAAKAWIVFHLLLPGLATYALGRTLGLGAAGALVAGVAIEFSGLVYGRTVCCPAYSQVAAWVPAALLAVELGLRAGTWLRRVAWWGVGGLALSQIMAAWIGQGTYYALLAFGAYAVYRTVVDPSCADGGAVGWGRRVTERLVVGGRRLGLHGGMTLLIGFGLAAAAILPRLEYYGRTNLAEGYTGALAWAAVLGGWTPTRVVGELLVPGLYYMGGATLAIAVLAPVLARGRFGVPFFALLAAGALVLASPATTPLHWLLYAVLPRFEALHRHWPERVMVVFVVAPAMLAGAAIEAMGRWRGRPGLLVFLAGLPVVAVLLVEDHAALPVPLNVDRAVVLAFLLLAGFALLSGTAVRRAVPVLLVLVVFGDLLAAGRFNLRNGLYGGYHEVDLEASARAEGAAAFLRERQKEEPARYFGYDPGIAGLTGAPDPPYRFHFADPRTGALLLNNRATLLGLQDVQGYNPLQPQRWVEYLAALNGFQQEYHEANVYAQGLGSPLLDLLNARYVVVPVGAPSWRQDLARLRAENPVVYEDGTVAVLERRGALPRAWIVHEARLVGTGEALQLLAGGGVDPRRVALLEEESPVLGMPSDPAADEAVVTSYEADEIEVRTRTGATGLLVMSEPYDPNWRAYVDGEEVPLYVADHLLRALAVPAGEHRVELRYVSEELRVGTVVSLGTIGAFGAVMVVLGWFGWRGRGGR